MAGVEREFKLRIPSGAHAQALLARLAAPAGPAAHQENHFFDTESRALGSARLALRLRDERAATAAAGAQGCRFTLTLKGPERGGESALTERAEVEREIEPAAARAILAGELCPLAALAARADGALVRAARERVASAPLRRLGSFANTRRRIGPLAFPPGSAGTPLVIELDETRFPDAEAEHELELELPEGAPAATIEAGLRALFASLAIPFQSAPSKAARFFEALERARARRFPAGGR